MAEIITEVLLENGGIGRLPFAAADIRKPLLAVSDCNKRGNPVWFDNEDSFIIPAQALELPAIRKAIAAVKKKIQLHLDNGTFKLRNWTKPATPFQGPGW